MSILQFNYPLNVRIYIYIYKPSVHCRVHPLSTPTPSNVGVARSFQRDTERGIKILLITTIIIIIIDIFIQIWLIRNCISYQKLMKGKVKKYYKNYDNSK